MMRVLASLMMMAIVVTARAAVDPATIGSWQAGTPGQMISLQIQPDGRCVLAGHQGMCATMGALLVFQSAVGALTYQWIAADGFLHLTRGDAGTTVSFRRAGSETTPQPESRSRRPATPASPKSAAPKQEATARTAPPEAGSPTAVSKEAWGITFAPPSGWRSVEKDGNVLVVSDTEAGLILLQFVPRMSRQEMLTAYREGVRDQGFMAMPIAEAADFDAPGGPALAGLMEGLAQDGTTIRVRSIGIVSRFGSAVVVLGLTTPAQFDNLRSRTEALARSIAFKSPPKAAPITGQYQFIYVSKVGSYSRESSLTLCASGRFSKSGEMSGSGSAGSAYVGRGNSGTWSAVGDGDAGTVTLNWSGGGTSTLSYRVSTNPRDRSGWGPAIRFGNDLYQKTGNGNC